MSIKTRIQLRRGNLADLPTLAAGEPGFTLDTYQLYIGDGVSNHLVSGSGGSAGGGDMVKAVYDPDADNSVELADAILGGSAAGNYKYYGTNASGVLSFYDVIPTTRAIGTAATSGLNGGGDLSADRDLVLDVSRLTAQLGSIASDDYLPIWNTSGPNMRKIAWTYFLLDVAANTKLDDLAVPDDNTDLNVSTSKHGLCPKAPNDTAKFLRGDATWAILGSGLTLDASLSADGNYSGIVEAGTAGATLAFGDLCYLAVADSRWELADADAEATAFGKLGICVLAAAEDGSATTILLWGKVRADAVFPALTIGAPVFVSTTAGDVQTTAPSGAADIIRIVGYGNTPDELFFCPSPDYFEHA